MYTYIWRDGEREGKGEKRVCGGEGNNERMRKDMNQSNSSTLSSVNYFTMKMCPNF